jgi:hypothetical protein
MRMNPVSSIDEALAHLASNVKGYIMPRGAALLPVISNNKAIHEITRTTVK